MKNQPAIHGLLAEFASPEALLQAAEKCRREGYRCMDGYTPLPIEGLAEALGKPRSMLPFFVLVAGVIGAAGGFLLQWFASVIDYPLNIGGRPLNSWPAFVIVSFELTILSSGMTAIFGMLLLNHLPQLHHPVFNADAFSKVTRDGFFLLIEARDLRFHEGTKSFLQSIGASTVIVVEV